MAGEDLLNELILLFFGQKRRIGLVEPVLRALEGEAEHEARVVVERVEDRRVTEIRHGDAEVRVRVVPTHPVGDVELPWSDAGVRRTPAAPAA